MLGKESLSYLGVPIVVDGQSEGVISVQSLTRRGRLRRRDQRLLATIAANVGVALRNARLFTDAQEARAAAEDAERGEELVPRDDESRDPHADERGDRHERAAPRHAARRPSNATSPTPSASPATRLLTIINDILDFSKIEAGRMDIESQPFDLRECVESALDLVSARARREASRLGVHLRGRRAALPCGATSPAFGRSCSTCCPTG